MRCLKLTHNLWRMGVRTMPDVRLIDANALMKRIKEVYCKDCNSHNGVMCRACEHMDDMDFIEDSPTINAQPVKHGEWIPSEMNVENKESAEMFGIDIETFLSKAAYCSCCGIQQITNGRDKTRKAMIHKAIYRYCPSCGAKMDGDSGD